MLEMTLLVKEQIVSHKRSTTFSSVANTSLWKPRLRISFQICSMGFIIQKGSKHSGFFLDAYIPMVAAIMIAGYCFQPVVSVFGYESSYRYLLNSYLEAVFITRIYYITLAAFAKLFYREIV